MTGFRRVLFRSDYLIVQHMEPDHSANISRFLEEYPQATVVATAKAFVMMKQFFGNDYADRRIVASEMSELSLGAHTLHFVLALRSITSCICAMVSASISRSAISLMRSKAFSAAP